MNDRLSNSNSDLAAIILAGGKSSRMGTDKALIEIEGIPLIQRITQIAQGLTPQVYVVTSTPEKYQSYLKGCELVKEIDPQGPLTGFAEGLSWTHTEWVLLLACDLPKLKLEPLQEWVSRLPEIAPEAIAYLPHHPKGWEPLCGFYGRSSLPHLQAYIASGGRSFQEWLAQHLVIEIPLAEPDLLFNCNTPADLNNILSNFSLALDNCDLKKKIAEN
ncbi:molybdenum cofactor guanylyltransferase [Merismopedia glauca]|uniref:Probable molybdenum cofactor guanylyltransferase n=1 Tax=Merismopedia glauca CCAP 1448/3 TaxID=1296344 RepID=A0A2T1C6P9_9CYAN|nr:molybdenum cofactor guanylyltransferase [Merismopedia glauca]PSB03950.1 molybdenum cofactor guanylyltransferase [Merismopedia glauca CCAP 1448/3]